LALPSALALPILLLLPKAAACLLRAPPLQGLPSALPLPPNWRNLKSERKNRTPQELKSYYLHFGIIDNLL
jgi:hypothetical protein